jgi:hypothetical protein
MLRGKSAPLTYRTKVAGCLSRLKFLEAHEVLLEGEEWRRPDTAVREAPAIGRMGTRRGVMSFYGAEFPSE